MATDWQPSASTAALRTRARVLRQMREFFFERDVLEVPTSVLARHGVTDPHIESIAVPDYGYLQTSPEYQLKRALAAGVPSCYQIGPAFRHGEAGRLHNPEFTLLEWYRIGMTDRELMAEVAALVDVILGADTTQTHTYAELLASVPAGPEHKKLGNPSAVGSDLDTDAAEDLQLVQAIEGLAHQGTNRVFITDYPARQAALARRRADNPDVAARFELVINGVEIANGYHELVDPVELRERFERDQRQRATKDLPPMSIDQRLLDAMHHGLPDCAGVAIGVDRLVMLAHGTNNLRDVLPFPTNLA